MLDQVEAQNKGNKLGMELGPGWKVDMWENLGWNYAAISPSRTVDVHPTDSNYLAFIHEPGEIGGQTGLTGNGDTPRKAVQDTVNRTRKEIAKLERWLEGVN